MSNELLEFFKFLNSGLLWIYLIVIIVVFYAILSLLTWSIKKPLMFLGIPSVIVGIFLIILRFSISFLLPNDLLMIFNSVVKPLFVNGIICIVVGIVMIVVYKVLNNIQKRKMIQEEDKVF